MNSRSASPVPRLRRLGVLAASTVLALLLAEVGFRLHAAVRGLPAEFTYSGTDRENLEAWLLGGLPGDGEGNLTRANAHHPVLGWVPRSNLRRMKVGQVLSPFSTNSIGLRGRAEFSREKPPGVRRVALIGDSFTFGLDKPDPKIWGRLLADELAPHEVLNFGVAGYGTDQACLSLTERALAYHPDVVVWGVFVLDPVRSSMHFTYFAKSWFALRDGELHLRGVPVPKPDVLMAAREETRPASYALCYARHCLDALAARDDDPIATPDRYLLELDRAILDRGRRLVREAGAKLLIVLIPKSDWPSVEASPVELDVREWAARARCPLIDLREVFAKRLTRDPGELDVVHYVPEHHFSAEGHRVVAEAVERRILALDWLPAEDADAEQ